MRMHWNSRSKSIIGVCLVFVWLFLFVYMTLIERTQSDIPTYNLRLFWCIWEAWTTQNVSDWFFIVGNILFFIPLGIILPLCFDRMRVWWWTVLLGFGFSLEIELAQLVFRRGLFEFDDIFNNTLGTLLGYGVFTLFAGIFGKKWKGRDVGSAMSFSAWIIVVCFLLVALCAGQPVFDGILAIIFR